jgi:DNA-binding NtrC family response regulator
MTYWSLEKLMPTHGRAWRGDVSSFARVVVVDDEPTVVEVFTEYLNLMGWQAVGFTSPHPALDLLRRQGHQLLVTDLLMPGLNGLQLAQAAKVAQPGLKVVLVSGVNPQSWPSTSKESLDQVDAVLAKPLPLEALSECCHRLLAEA